MGIIAEHIIREVILPACDILSLSGMNAIALLAGTAANESQLGAYLLQQGLEPWKNGGAYKGGLGLFQMEEATHDDIWANVLAGNPVLRQKMTRAFPAHDPINMVTDMLYAACMCRLQYFRFSEPLPDWHNIESLYAYYKKYYNTPIGKATLSGFKDAFKLVQPALLAL